MSNVRHDHKHALETLAKGINDVTQAAERGEIGGNEAKSAAVTMALVGIADAIWAVAEQLEDLK